MCRFFATAPKGLSEILRDELIALGATQVKVQPTGATFEGQLDVGYKVCLWSRIANRVYLILKETQLDNQEALSTEVQQVDWNQHFDAESTFAVSFTGQGVGITHSHYGALKIKDGIVDYFREHFNKRPSVDVDYPDVQIHGHLNRNQLTLSLDLVGYSLHQRGYREGQQVKAPLKENVAAAILMRARWPEIAAAGGTFYDPMCGSGTFLIEAAMMASDCAPGLAKARSMALNRWLGHDDDLWKSLIEQAHQRESNGLDKLPLILGSDVSHKSLDIAQQAIQNAGYADVIEIKQMSVSQASKWRSANKGLIVTNPPYGERLGEVETVKKDYIELGDLLKKQFAGWEAAVLTCNAELGKYMGIKALRSHDFYNGALACKLFRFKVEESYFRRPALQTTQDLAAQVQLLHPELADSDNAKMFANRLKKNLKNLKSWIKQQDIQAYRIYDADIPEYALAIDVYHTVETGTWVLVAEYAAPKTVNPTKARHRLYEALSALPETLQVPVERIVFKVRSQQKGDSQYEKQDQQGKRLTIIENQAKLKVNFTDYLDSGVFLDHRMVRQKVAQLSRDKTLLNLFCYTATATTEAAVAGCQSSLSVDMSKTYLDWAKENFKANQIDVWKHKLQQANVIEWLEQQAEKPQQKFDVIFIDPPSFSNSKRMKGTLDIQRDHVDLLKMALKLLSDKGRLIFSTNLRKFKLSNEAFADLWEIKDITRETMPKDFLRNQKIHQVWEFSLKET